ncbi:uncharacterized protein ARMOST_15970 [Armillaria ostoyae]|uniref:DUF6535 domain-containing protein n=1 Tax=Armillaria ostoyae TaxID=47428 RepID=A0A284RUX2_ARMOS|nr:uncharacterized protein ARMOST_15970 [Armillaria ostoyae]
MDSSENRTGDPSHPPACGTSTLAAAAAAAEGAHFQHNVPSGTFFGLNRCHLHSWGVGATPRNYKARYPPDPRGQEMSENARIWPIYLEEAADFDASMLAEWRDTIDVLLVFAGLFSAVLTTFVVQTSQNMQPDYNEAPMFLLFEILKATASNGTQISIPSTPTSFFSSSRSDEWLNSLWFVSLTLSLITALVAVLVKQWLHQYVAIVSDSSAHGRARIRHLRYAGLQTWQVPMIIGLLPVLLHVSLALFCWPRYFLVLSGHETLILPLIYPYCPYKVPLALYVHHLYQYVPRLYLYGNSYLIPRIRYYIIFMRHYPYTQVFGRSRNDCLYRHQRWLEEWERQEQQERRERQQSLIPFRQKFLTLKETEHDYIQQYATMTDAQSLLWLHSSTSNASVHQSVLQAISGMTDSIPATEDVSALVKSLHQQIEHIKALVRSSGAESEVVELKLYCRALSVLCGHPMDEHSNKQLNVLLSSMTTTEKTTATFLRILHGSQRSSLRLHSEVWKILVDITISSPPVCSGAMGLELELMKILASPSTRSESKYPTTIDNLTDEMRGYMCDKLLACWGYGRTQTSSIRIIHHRLGIMLSLIPRIHQRLLDSSHASDRKEVIEITLVVVKGILLVIDSSEASGVNVDVEIFACGISMIFNTDQSQWIQTMLAARPRMDTYSRVIDTGIDTLVDIMLLLIDRHRERVLYAWVEGRCTIHVWKECVSRLIRWASGEEFRRWTFLKRVLAIVVIRELETRLDVSDDDDYELSLPQYDNEAYVEVN